MWSARILIWFTVTQQTTLLRQSAMSNTICVGHQLHKCRMHMRRPTRMAHRPITNVARTMRVRRAMVSCKPLRSALVLLLLLLLSSGGADPWHALHNDIVHSCYMCDARMLCRVAGSNSSSGCYNNLNDDTTRKKPQHFTRVYSNLQCDDAL